MKRPFWIWIVVVFAIYHALTSLFGGIYGIVVALKPEILQRYYEGLQTQLQQLPSQGFNDSNQMASIIESFNKSKEMYSNEYYRYFQILSGAMFLILGGGFLIGIFRLIGMRYSSISLLILLLLSEIFITVLQYVFMSVLGLLPSFPEALGSTMAAAMIISTGVTIFLSSGIPLLCLWFCDRSDFDTAR